MTELVAHRNHAFTLDFLPNVWRCDCGDSMTDEYMHARFAQQVSLTDGTVR